MGKSSILCPRIGWNSRSPADLPIQRPWIFTIAEPWKDGTVRLWSVVPRDDFQSMALLEHRSPVRAVFLSEDLQYVYSMTLSRRDWGDCGCWLGLPSGELTFCHGKSPFLMGKSTISMAIFHCYVSLPEGISQYITKYLPAMAGVMAEGGWPWWPFTESPLKYPVNFPSSSKYVSKAFPVPTWWALLILSPWYAPTESYAMCNHVHLHWHLYLLYILQ